MHSACARGVQLALCMCKWGTACTVHVHVGCSLHHACTKGVHLAPCLCKQGAPCTLHVQRGCTLHSARASGVQLALCIHKQGAVCTLHMHTGCSLHFPRTKRLQLAPCTGRLQFALCTCTSRICGVHQQPLGTYRATCMGTYRSGRACVCRRLSVGDAACGCSPYRAPGHAL